MKVSKSVRPFFLWPLLFVCIYTCYLLGCHFAGVSSQPVTQIQFETIVWTLPPSTFWHGIIAAAVAGLLVALAGRLSGHWSVAGATFVAGGFMLALVVSTLVFWLVPLLVGAEYQYITAIYIIVGIMLAGVVSFGFFNAILLNSIIVPASLTMTAVTTAFYLKPFGAYSLLIGFTISVMVVVSLLVVFRFIECIATTEEWVRKRWESNAAAPLRRLFEEGGAVHRFFHILAGLNGD